MTRREKIFQLVDESLQPKFEKSLDLIDDYYTGNKEAIQSYFIKSINSLIELVKSQQERGIKRDIAYMNICFLRSSVLTESYDFMISLYDDKFYLDKTETHIYFKLDFIFEHINKDIDEIRKEFLIYPAIKKYELKEIRFSYAQYHFIYAMKIIQKLCEDIGIKSHLLTFEDLNIKEDFKIIIGGHMEEGLLIGKEAQL